MAGTAVTIGTIGKADLPFDYKAGTASTRILVYVNCTVDGGSTLCLSTTYPEIVDIEGIMFESDDSAVPASPNTWSSGTITFTQSGYQEVIAVCRTSTGMK